MRVGGRNIATFGPTYNKYTPHQKMGIQRYVMQQAARKAIENSAIFSSNVFGATTSLFQGLAALSLQAATQKTQAALAAKVEELKSLDVSV